MAGLLDVATSIVLKETVKSSIYTAVDYIKKQYQLLNFSPQSYLKYCTSILTIKTLGTGDNAISVEDIYVPISLRPSDSNRSFDVGDNTTLDGEERAILIKGLAGQGKSTLLRILLSNNCKSYNRLPIFYELKNYKGGPIEDALAKSFKNYGVKLGASAVSDILSDSNVKLYLDAFDEVAPKYRESLVYEITRLSNSKGCHIICTTRPDTEIESEPYFKVFNVCELKESQIFGIINKTCLEKRKADDLCEALKRSSVYNRDGSPLKSPILVVLFCISYNIGEDIPDTLSQFYSNIFETVFYRHDNLKGRVERLRLWNDNRRIYREIFDSLSFFTLSIGAADLSRDDIIRKMDKSLSYVDQSKDHSERAFDELVSITNLIIEDGYREYKYIHKSIQEFYASSFIKNLDHKKKIQFYKKASIENEYYSVFQNVLFFLQELDYYDYCEYFYIPAVRRFLGEEVRIVDKDYIFSAKTYKSILNSISFLCEIEKNRIKTKIEYGVKINRLINVHEDVNYIGSRIIASAITLINQKIELNKLKELAFGKFKKSSSSKILYTLHELIFEHKLISKKAFEDAVFLAMAIELKDDFNIAVEKISRRRKALEADDLLDI